MTPASRPIVLPCRVDTHEALTYLGYRGQALDDDLQRRFETAAARCEEELTPAGMFAIFPLDRDCGEAGSGEDPLIVRTPNGPLELPGKAIARHLRGCSEAALMAVTLGARSEMLLRREAALSATDGMLADVCASSAAEQAAEALGERLRAVAEQRGLSVTWRFSPGYGDLPLSVQPALLRALGADKALGISLTPALMLVPAKTITAIAGLYRPADRPKVASSSPSPTPNETEGAEDGARP